MTKTGTKTPDRPAPWPSGLLIVDKPAGMTSHDVVARVRRVAHTRRVGHAGTLDPMATGVLVIGIEKATRLLGYLALTEKTYEAVIRLGLSMTTDDAEGEPVGAIVPAARVVSGEALNAEIDRLTGDIMQVPSSVSAIKVNGQRAYKLTRAGEAPELAARMVTIHEFRILGLSGEDDFMDVAVRVRCSSGTYIRALARDLGAALGTGGHLTALRRTDVGPYALVQAHTLEKLEELGDQAVADGWLTPLAEAAAAAFPRLDLTADDALRLAQGAKLPLPADWSPPVAPGDPLAAFDPDGTLVALVTVEEGRIRSLAVFTGVS